MIPDPGGKGGTGIEAQRCLLRCLSPQAADTSQLSATRRWLASYALAVLHQRAGDPASAAEQFRACLVSIGLTLTRT